MVLFTCIITRRMELSRTRTQCCVILMLECTGILAAFSRLPPLARQTEVAYECPAVCVVRFLRIHRFPLLSPENRSSLRCRQKEKALISLGNQGFATFASLQSGTTRNRTGDTRIFSPLLYQLSYGTIRKALRTSAKGDRNNRPTPSADPPSPAARRSLHSPASGASRIRGDGKQGLFRSLCAGKGNQKNRTLQENATFLSHNSRPALPPPRGIRRKPPHKQLINKAINDCYSIPANKSDTHHFSTRPPFTRKSPAGGTIRAAAGSSAYGITLPLLHEGRPPILPDNPHRRAETGGIISRRDLSS